MKVTATKTYNTLEFTAIGTLLHLLNKTRITCITYTAFTVSVITHCEYC